MSRTLLWLAGAMSGLLIVFASWTAADRAFAHGTPCGTPNPPCNTNDSDYASRYYASQTANGYFPQTAYSNGIRGYLSIADVSLRDITCADSSADPKCDFLGNGLIMATDLGDDLQIGFFEGAIPWPPANFNSSSPKLVTEASSTCFGKQWYVRSTPAPNPRYNEYVGLRWAGQTGTCGGSQACFWYWERGGNFAGFDVTFLRGCQGIYIAQTEHFDNTHMEPNSTQCFGAALCTSSYGFDLWLWNQAGGYFYLWDTNLPQPIITDSNHGNPPAQYGNGYTLDHLQPFYEFRTHGTWP